MGVDEHVDDLGVDHRTTAGYGGHGSHELAGVNDALLQQVRPAFSPILEQSQGVFRLGVLAQYDHADLRSLAAELSRQPESLVAAFRSKPLVMRSMSTPRSNSAKMPSNCKS